MNLGSDSRVRTGLFFWNQVTATASNIENLKSIEVRKGIIGPQDEGWDWDDFVFRSLNEGGRNPFAHRRYDMPLPG